MKNETLWRARARAGVPPAQPAESLGARRRCRSSRADAACRTEGRAGRARPQADGASGRSTRPAGVPKPACAATRRNRRTESVARGGRDAVRELSVVCLRELGEQDPSRTVVRDEVMTDEQDPILHIEMKECRANHGVSFKVEAPPREVRDDRGGELGRIGTTRRSCTSSSMIRSSCASCTGVPSTSEIPVRSATCRTAMAFSARCRAAASSRPRTDRSRGTLYALTFGSIRSSSHMRSCANESGAASPSSRRGIDPAVTVPRRAKSCRSASARDGVAIRDRGSMRPCRHLSPRALRRRSPRREPKRSER